MRVEHISEGKYDNWEKRMEDNASTKKVMANKCIESGLISRHDHLYLDLGTTFVYLAEAIFSNINLLAPLSITTPNVEIFHRFYDSKKFDLVDFRMIGGRYVSYHRCFSGSDKENNHKTIIPEGTQFHKTFIGVSSLGADGILSVVLQDIVGGKEYAISHTGCVIILCDSSKLIQSSRGEVKYASIFINKTGNLVIKLINKISPEIPVVLVVGKTTPSLPQWLNKIDKQYNLTKQGNLLVF